MLSLVLALWLGVPGAPPFIPANLKGVVKAEKARKLTQEARRALTRDAVVVVEGQEGLGIVYAGANSMKSGHYISEHDQLISQKLGYVLCGGDLSARTTVSEQYLLDLERKIFLELCMEKKSLERMQSLLTTGKILRN